MLHIRLYTGISESSSDETLSIEYGVGSIHCCLRLGSISNKTLGLIECYVRGSGTISLVVCNDFYSVILPYSNAGIGSSKINSNRFSSYSCIDTIDWKWVRFQIEMNDWELNYYLTSSRMGVSNLSFDWSVYALLQMLPWMSARTYQPFWFSCCI